MVACTRLKTPRCQVTSLLEYKTHLNPGSTCFWQRPKSKAPEEGPWYDNAPLGVNAIGNKMKMIAEAAGCTQKYSNHSLRATTVSVLDEAGFESRDIMAVTGHKSESSLKHYTKTSAEKKKKMSARLAKGMQENQTRPRSSAGLSLEGLHLPALPVAQDSSAVIADLQQDLQTDGASVSNLSLSQEQVILQESNLNIQSSTSSNSTVQHFFFHGPVTFYNKA